MTKWIENIRVVVGEYNGGGIFSPFPFWDDHSGESYWLAGHELKVLETNEIHIPRKLMRELAVKRGYLRSDGKFAIAVKSKRFGKDHKLAFGGEVIYSKDAEVYLEEGKNNSFIPNGVFDKGMKRLRVQDYTEGYSLEFNVEDDI